MASDASGILGPLDRRDEVARKIARVAGLARHEGLHGIVLSGQHNFAWITAGRSNRIDASREGGSAAILVTADQRRFALANSIEHLRMSEETIAGLGFELVSFPWSAERAHPALAVERAADLARGPVGTDLVSPAARSVEGALSALRCQMDPDEIPRYRELAATCGRVVGQATAGMSPGMTEIDVARQVSAALASDGIRATVVLVGADRRIDRYRHPVPTDLPWLERLMVVVCAERNGQVVALSRLMARHPDEELARRTVAAAGVCGALMRACVPGRTGAELFRAASDAYAAAGFPGEEERHHQGGAIAYRSREWVAHPASTDIVTPAGAFAWNPSITGTKVEDTSLVLDDGRVEVLTASPGWPTIQVEVRGRPMSLAGILTRGD